MDRLGAGEVFSVAEKERKIASLMIPEDAAERREWLQLQGNFPTHPHSLYVHVHPSHVILPENKMEFVDTGDLESGLVSYA